MSAEKSGGNVNYYVVDIPKPKRLDPYTAECEDIIEALGMTFAEGCAFKAIWRSCAARTLGKLKAGADEHGVYDAEKVQYYGGRMIAQRKRLQETITHEIKLATPLAFESAPEVVLPEDKRRCVCEFKGADCGYSGPSVGCDKTVGWCRHLDNALHFKTHF